MKDAEEFDAEQDELIKAHEEKKANVKMEYMAKDVELEEELYAALTSLMEKHKPDIFQPSSPWRAAGLQLTIYMPCSQ